MDLDVIAERFRKNSAEFKTLIEDISKNGLERTLKSIILFPLEQDKMIAASSEEARLLTLSLQMLDDKFMLIASQLQNKEGKPDEQSK